MRERVTVEWCGGCVILCVGWLVACGSTSSRAVLPGLAVPAETSVIVRLRTRDRIVSVFAGGESGPDFAVSASDGTPLSGLLTRDEFEREFPVAAARYRATLADDSAPLIHALLPESRAGPEVDGPEVDGARFRWIR